MKTTIRRLAPGNVVLLVISTLPQRCRLARPGAGAIQCVNLKVEEQRAELKQEQTKTTELKPSLNALKELVPIMTQN